jgi:predicted GH43/DUF377 family glycosyl hydrolase
MKSAVYSIFSLVFLLCYEQLYADYSKSLIVRSYDEVKHEMGFYLMYYEDNSIFEIPDNVTLTAIAQELSVKLEDLPLTPFAFIPGVFNAKGKLPSLLSSNNSRIIVAEVIERSLFFRDSSLTPLPLWNPSVVYWQGKYLLCWRDGGKIGFGWRSSDGKSMDSKSYLGLGGQDPLTKNPIQSGIIEQEDPRMLVLSDNRLVVSFTGFFPDPKRPHVRIGRNIQCFIFASYSPTLQKIIFEGNITKFDQQFDSPRQKNWVPFEYKGSLHFIQNIPKMKVFKFLSRDLNTNTGLYKEVSTSPFSMRGVKWKSKVFGGHFRGGTPAISITIPEKEKEKDLSSTTSATATVNSSKSCYLMLFHTSFSHRFSEYFMGAMTFCPNPPFALHGISSFPILRTEQFYTGEFINGFLHYVVYPSGLIAHPDPEKRNSTLLLSFGHQDKKGYLVDVDISGLVDSLQVIGNC